MKVINFFGGPGLGKSTLAFGLAYLLKRNKKQAEYIPEYPKELVHRNNMSVLSNQILILGEQYQRLLDLEKHKYQYVVNDASFLMNIYYNNNSFLNNYESLVVELFNKFNNINILIERDEDIKYIKQGRYQSEIEAKQIDPIVEKLLMHHNLNFIRFKASESILNLYKTITNEESNFSL